MSETKMSSKMSLNGPEKSSMPEGIPIKNPFIHSISYGGRLDKIRVSIWVFNVNKQRSYFWFIQNLEQ